MRIVERACACQTRYPTLLDEPLMTPRFHASTLPRAVIIYRRTELADIFVSDVSLRNRNGGYAVDANYRRVGRSVENFSP